MKRYAGLMVALVVLPIATAACDSSANISTPSPDGGADSPDGLADVTADEPVREDDAGVVTDRADAAAVRVDAAADAPVATCEVDGGPAYSEWRGSISSGTSRDSSYLRLAVCGTRVTGEACETPTRDCYPLMNGSLVGSALHFEYTFSSVRVTADLTLLPGSNFMSGMVSTTRGFSGTASYARN